LVKSKGLATDAFVRERSSTNLKGHGKGVRMVTAAT